ncbi:SCO family protein [Paenibacillus sp. IB182496]|uniref:SCO family protein n=1 Tax=Paenibacillus sabuli TaxID=2772509 RepID=A0A927BVR6_9BACL|nr:SCO family protein [Paenibacillus sabuli]MBD2847737.1 SCO family protein [Paenibacillus sabuli]
MNSNATPRSSRPYLIAAAVLLIALAAYLLYPVLAGGDKLPVVMDAPDFALTDPAGAPVTQADFDGQVRLVEFIFTSCPDICPATTANMVQMQEPLKEKGWFGDEVQFVAITFDPETDTPERLAEYADRMGMDLSGWTLIRDDEQKTKDYAANFNISIQRLDQGQYMHSVTSLLLIDGQHRVRKIYKMGEDMNNDQIMADLESVVTERSPS